MAKHQLTLSPEYVKDWTYLEAVRELFQNALDNQTTNPENEMYFSYEDSVLTIGNKTSVLTLDTLLLGSSSKRDDENTIGKHGEGYKVALMVLLREGKQVTIYNYGVREIWKTRLVKSRKFNGALITEVDVQKKAFFQSVPSHNLTIVVEGVSEEEYENIVASNLHLQDDVPKFETSNNTGDILISPEHKGKIFVNGLYITKNEKFHYGYNMTPKNINLDRDRKLIDSFNLSWETSRLWRYVGQETLVADLILKEAIDVKYVKSRGDSYSIEGEKEKSVDKKIAESLKTSFIQQHGSKSIPISSNSDLQKVSKASGGYKPVMVTSGVTEYLKEVVEMPEVLTKTTAEGFQDWLEKVRHKLTDEEIEDFKILLSELTPF